MKEEMLRYLDERIAWHRQVQARLKAEFRQDEAVHVQIAINVYNIFLSTYRAMQFDLSETLRRFNSIVSTWEENRRAACAHGDDTKKFVEEIKINRATEILRYAKKLEAHV